MERQLLCVDLDGTLLDNRKQLPEENREALCRAWEAGIEICIASGRGGNSAAAYLEQMGIRGSAVALNGGQVICHGREISRGRLEPETVEAVIDLAESEQVRTYFHDGFRTAAMNETMEEIRSRIKDTPWMLPFYEAVSGQELRRRLKQGEITVVKISIREDDGNRLERLRQMVHEKTAAEAAKSDVNYLDIFPAGQSKWSGIRKLLEHLDISPEHCICFGDNENDREMLEQAGTGIAMENATPELKALADHVTLSNEARGVAYGVYTWVLKEKGLKEG